MNFINFRDFSGIFFEFILDLFGFTWIFKNKKSSFYRALMRQRNDMLPYENVYTRHMKTCTRVTGLTCVYACECMCASVCACVCTQV